AVSSEDGVEDVCMDGEESVELLKLASEIIFLAKKLDVQTSIRLEVDEEYTEIDNLEPYLNETYR
ncbi:MAG TPA: hypothetical protein DIT31_05590, partial [Methylophaga sp.]|nr:hypothetical protein [Methylophaga sp.]